MAEIKKLRFLMPRGYGAIRFSTGAVADVPEPWASHFLKNGSAEIAEQPAEAPKPKGKGKKSKDVDPGR